VTNRNFLIVGYGVVGKAVFAGLTMMRHCYIEIHDPEKGYDNPLRDDYDGVILCLPTPQGLTGECDDMLVEQYHQEIRGSMPRVPILIKSTVSLELIEQLQDDYYLTYNPEFLTEKDSINEFLNQEFAIFGGADCRFWYEIFKGAGIKMNNVKFTSMKNAAFAKYTINSFLATKVIFFNELRGLYSSKSFDELTELVAMDPRIGESHMMVPGSDMKRGFGGKCLPKDTSAFVTSAKRKGSPLTLLEKVIEINKAIR
jgi:UDPglucose 6-dehydrogenase